VLGSFHVKGITGSGWTARRVHFSGGADCAQLGSHILIEDSFCEIPAGRDVGDAHVDGFEDTLGPTDMVVRHNTIRNPYPQTSAILMPDSDRVTIVDNLLAGGGWTVYCPRAAGATAIFSGNRISNLFYPMGGQYGPDDACPNGTGNVWDQTGAPLVTD
jgi:hypothetical protein